MKHDHDKTQGEGIERELHDPDLRQADSAGAARSLEDPLHRRPGPCNGQHSLHRPPGRRGRRRTGSHGARQRLFRGDDARRRYDRRQAGTHRHRSDRSRSREGHHLYRSAHGARTGRGGWPLALSVRPEDGRHRALRGGLQPRLRHAGAGDQPRFRGDDRCPHS